MFDALNHCRQPTRKEPFTLPMFDDAYSLDGTSQNLIHMRFLLVCLLGFSGFLRIGELLAIQIKDISFQPDHMEITVPRSKRDQLREGHIVFISRTGSERCPVAWTEKYLTHTTLYRNPNNYLISRLARTKRGHNPNNYLISRLARTKRGHNPNNYLISRLARTKRGHNPNNYLISRLARTKRGHNAIGGRSLSYSRIRTNFLELLTPVWADCGEVRKYGLHSLRSGGASEAANNDVSDRLIGKHGRWSSNTSRDTYIKDNTWKRLSVTQALGL